MNVLFISISSLPHVREPGISLDLLHEFKRKNHNVFIVCALEKTDSRETFISEEDGCKILRVKIGKNKKANLLEKGLTTVLLPQKYISAIKQYYSDVKFDLILYPTPPITHVKTVEYVKRRDGAQSYLLLKDIFPQNAIDIGMMSKSGIKGFLYKQFRKTEKKLYELSDYIGCMSQANVKYVLKHNSEITPEKVEICPNSIEINDKSIDDKSRKIIRDRYQIPNDKIVFIYGGNLGKPQDIPYIIKCLSSSADIKEAFFVIAGDGTEYEKLAMFIKENNPQNVLLMRKLSKSDYDELVASCDIGLIFLDHRFTIPNFPSRLLSYMQAKIPVLACTDPNTDIGTVIQEGQFGWWCESNNTNTFREKVWIAINSDRKSMGNKGFDYLNNHYTSEKAYNIIMNHFD